jgi:hypothetical protein
MNEFRIRHWREMASLRPSEVAIVTGLSKNTVWRRIDDGTLLAVKVDGCVLVPVSAVRRMVGETVETPEGTKRAARIMNDVRGTLESC